MKKRIRTTAGRLDAAGSVFLATTLALMLTALFAIAAPSASADKHDKMSPDNSVAQALDKRFKGKLPITELTEDEAILHALNRLGYGPRPGDVDRIREMGLEKWIDQQLHPESIDDSVLDTRLEKYPTLTMSSQKLLEEFPPPNQAAKQEGETKE